MISNRYLILKIAACLSSVFCIHPALQAQSAAVEYCSDDSARVVHLMNDMRKVKRTDDKIFCAAFEFKGIPYGGLGVSEPERERLVIGFKRLDCVTFVENVLAMVWGQKICEANPSAHPFDSYCNALRKIRYRGGVVTDYTSRLHYISQWITDPAKSSLIYEVGGPAFTARQLLTLNYMSSHLQSYPELRKNIKFQKIIRMQEKACSGRTIHYIPKDKLNATQAELGIHDGDVLAIVTNKAGLDVSHVGFALWIDGVLHMVHASSLHKKVIVDTQSLYDYMANKHVQLGVRVFRIKL